MDKEFYTNTINHSIHAHADNVKAGWWTDIKTGESTLLTRNRAEMLMLTVSELSEAHMGIGLRDDKLPDEDGFIVEMADAVIRAWDQIGAFISIWGSAPSYDMVYQNRVNIRSECMIPETVLVNFAAHGPLFLLCGVNLLSHAMECNRKGRANEYFASLMCFVEHCFNTVALAGEDHVSFYEVIRKKQNFNANRADHKIENRLKADGKKF